MTGVWRWLFGGADFHHNIDIASFSLLGQEAMLSVLAEAICGTNAARLYHLVS